MRKVYIKVNADFDTNGNITPKSIVWEDEKVYTIDRITDTRRAASLKAGGIGLRYSCSIEGKDAYLFYEEPAWFMEGKD